MKKMAWVIMGVLMLSSSLKVKAEVDPNFHIYICFGQSNMEGNAQWQSQDVGNVDARFQMLATCNFDNPKRTLGNWYKAECPIVSPQGKLGPTDYFGRTMVAHLPDIKIGVIAVAMGGSPIEMFDKDKYQQKLADNPNEWWAQLSKWYYGGNPYGRIIEMAKKAQTVGVIKGILLHQGCSNNGDPNWPNMVKKIYNDMLSDLGLATDTVPLFVGETLRQEQGGACYGHNTQVARMPSVVRNSHVISSEGCPGNGADPWHFNALGYRMMGSRYAGEALYTLGQVYPYFSFHQFDLIAGKNCSYTESTRTLTATAPGIVTWTYPRLADWSSYKYLVVKLKEPQTANAQIWLYKKSGTSGSIAYRDTINDRTTVVIDLHHLKYGNNTMDPSKVYKMVFRFVQAGTIKLDDVFLSNDEQYDSALTAISGIDTDSNAFRAPLYSLDGRLAAPRKLKAGIYINKGRKILVR